MRKLKQEKEIELEQLHEDLDDLIIKLETLDFKNSKPLPERTMCRQNDIGVCLDKRLLWYVYTGKNEYDKFWTVVFSDDKNNLWLREESRDMLGWGVNYEDRFRYTVKIVNTVNNIKILFKIMTLIEKIEKLKE